MIKVSFTYLSHRHRMLSRAKDPDFELYHEHVGNERANGRTHGSTMDLFVILTLEEEVSIFEAKLQEFDYFCIDMLVLCERSGSMLVSISHVGVPPITFIIHCTSQYTPNIQTPPFQ